MESTVQSILDTGINMIIQTIIGVVLFGSTAALIGEQIDSKVSVNISYTPVWDASTNSVYYIADKQIVQYDFGKNQFSKFAIKGFGNVIPRFVIPITKTKMILATLTELAFISRKENSNIFYDHELISTVKFKNMVFSSNGRCDTEGRLFLVSFDDSIKGQDILWKLVDGSLEKVKTLGPTSHYEFIWNKEGNKLYFTSESADKTVIYEYEFNAKEGTVGAQRSLVEFEGKGVGINVAIDGSLLVEDFYEPVIYRINVTSQDVEEMIHFPTSKRPYYQSLLMDGKFRYRSYLQSVFVGKDLKQLFVIQGSVTNSKFSTYSFEQYLISALDVQGIPRNKCYFDNIS